MPEVIKHVCRAASLTNVVSRKPWLLTSQVRGSAFTNTDTWTSTPLHPAFDIDTCWTIQTLKWRVESGRAC